MTSRDETRPKRDRVSRSGCDRRLTTDPPAPGYVRVGWYCVYHEGPHGDIRCHNPLDCDVTPMWALSRESFLIRLRLALEARRAARA